MASCSGNGSRGHHKFTLNVNETYVSDASNNYSDVAWSLVLSPITSGYDWNHSSTVPVTYSVNVNGAVSSGNIMKYDGSSTVSVASGSTRVYHNNDGTKSIGFSFSVSSIDKSYLPGSASGSGSMNLTTIARYLTITKHKLKETSPTRLTIEWATNVARDKTQYSLNGGSWADASDTIISNTSGYYTISGLNPNTSYTVKTRLRRTDSGLYTESDVLNLKTTGQTAYYKVNGSWKKATFFVKENQEWKLAISNYKNNGWKRGIV